MSAFLTTFPERAYHFQSCFFSKVAHIAHVRVALPHKIAHISRNARMSRSIAAAAAMARRYAYQLRGAALTWRRLVYALAHALCRANYPLSGGPLSKLD